MMVSVQCTCIHKLYICCVPTTLVQSIAHEIQNLSNHYDGRIFWAIDRTTCHLLLNVLSVCLWFVCMCFFFSDFFSKPNISFTRYFPLQHHFQSRFFNCIFFFAKIFYLFILMLVFFFLSLDVDYSFKIPILLIEWDIRVFTVQHTAVFHSFILCIRVYFWLAEFQFDEITLLSSSNHRTFNVLW